MSQASISSNFVVLYYSSAGGEADAPPEGIQKDFLDAVKRGNVDKVPETSVVL